MGQVGAFHGEPPAHDPRTGVSHMFSVTISVTNLFAFNSNTVYIGYLLSLTVWLHCFLSLPEQIDVMRNNAAGRIDVYRADLERFKAHWDQLKPKDEMLESGDHAALLHCLQTIKDKQQEFEELELVRNKLL